MPYKDPEEQKRRQKELYQKNKKVYLKRNRERRERYKRIVDEIKSAPCMDCGKLYPPWVMDLDHVRGEKIRDVSKLNSFSTEKKLLEEIEKCDVVCANCHRQRTHDRLQGD